MGERLANPRGQRFLVANQRFRQHHIASHDTPGHGREGFRSIHFFGMFLIHQPLTYHFLALVPTLTLIRQQVQGAGRVATSAGLVPRT